MSFRRTLAHYWASLWRRTSDTHGTHSDSTTPAEAARLEQRFDDTRRWAEERKHFWAEYHEGQRQAEERSRLP